MRYTFSLSRGGAMAVATGAVAGTALVFAAGLLVGTAAATPDAPALALAAVDSTDAAARADSAAADSAAAVDAMELPAFADCVEPPAAAVSWSTWTGGGGQMAHLRAVDLPGYDGTSSARPRPIRLPEYTGGPDPYAADDSDGRTMGTFTDEQLAVALMDRITDAGTQSFIDARLGPDGVPVFRVRTGDPEEDQ
jgi:hypothetical protein